MRVRAARGAIRVSEDTAETVLTSTTRLLEAILQRNEVEHDDLVSAFFTVTEDLRSAFPARPLGGWDSGGCRCCARRRSPSRAR